MPSFKKMESRRFAPLYYLKICEFCETSLLNAGAVRNLLLRALIKTLTKALALTAAAGAAPGSAPEGTAIFVA
jgi:hypothetical protein